MKRWAIGAAAFWMAVLVATVATARPPMKWWQDDRVKAELRLSAEQSNRIEEIFQASFPKLRASAEELKRREDQLSNLISGRNTTEADVLRQADQVEELRGGLNKARILMLYRMRQVLSPEQRLKLQEIQQRQREERRQPSER